MRFLFRRPNILLLTTQAAKRSPIRPLTTVSIVFPLLFLLLLKATLPFHAQVIAPPQTSNAWLQIVTQAVNNHELAPLQPYTSEAPSTIFTWLERSTSPSWQAKLLSIPQLPKAPRFIVFTAWHTCQSEGDHVHILIPTPQGWKIGPEWREDVTGGYQVKNHLLSVSVQPSTHTVFCKDQATIAQLNPSPLPFCLMRLSPDFRISRFQINGQAVPFHRAGSVVAFVPPHLSSFCVDTAYSGRLNHANGDYVLTSEAVINTNWYPQIARLPATATFRVTAPPGWLPIAPGNLVDVLKNADGSLTRVFQNDVPVSYFTVAMGPYQRYITEHQGIHLAVYLLHYYPSLPDRCLNLLKTAIEFYSSHFAPFPYKRYTLVETDGPFDGALEAYSFATFEKGTMADLLPHELAHTWWGGLLPCTYLHSMWDEAFADYSAELFQRECLHKLPSWQPSEGHKFWGHQFDALSVAECKDTTDPQQCDIGYTKGCLVLRALEAEIGLSKMYTCLQTFLAHRTRGSLSEWKDFENVVAEVTGKDFSTFFQEWLLRRGLPQLQFTHVRLYQSGSHYIIRGYLTQTAPYYHLRVPLQVRTTSTAHSFIQYVVTNSLNTPFAITLPEQPSLLLLDPANTIPLGSSDCAIWRF